MTIPSPNPSWTGRFKATPTESPPPCSPVTRKPCKRASMPSQDPPSPRSDPPTPPSGPPMIWIADPPPGPQSTQRQWAEWYATQTLEACVARWRELRAEHVPAGCQTREVAALMGRIRGSSAYLEVYKAASDTQDGPTMPDDEYGGNVAHKRSWCVAIVSPPHTPSPDRATAAAPVEAPRRPAPAGPHT
jgi:hypothetical protein